jgi:hypothetical protein
MKSDLSTSGLTLLAASALALTWFASEHVTSRFMAIETGPAACRSVAGSEPNRLAGADIDDPISDEPPLLTY